MDVPYNVVTGQPEAASLQGFTLPRRIRAWLAGRRAAARVAAELQQYSDRELLDIGLTRADIPAVARGESRRY